MYILIELNSLQIYSISSVIHVFPIRMFDILMSGWWRGSKNCLTFLRVLGGGKPVRDRVVGWQWNLHGGRSDLCREGRGSVKLCLHYAASVRLLTAGAMWRQAKSKRWGGGLKCEDT